MASVLKNREICARTALLFDEIGTARCLYFEPGSRTTQAVLKSGRNQNETRFKRWATPARLISAHAKANACMATAAMVAIFPQHGTSG
jgi:hypothetical protein